jgi:hypothetical protein
MSQNRENTPLQKIKEYFSFEVPVDLTGIYGVIYQIIVQEARKRRQEGGKRNKDTEETGILL